MSEAEVKQAEEAVQKSTEEFEQAMKQLQAMVEDKSEKIATALQMAQETLEKSKKAIADVIVAARPLAEIVREPPGKYVAAVFLSVFVAGLAYSWGRVGHRQPAGTQQTWRQVG